MERARYRIIFAENSVLQDIRQLPKSIQQLIGRALKDRLSIDPLSYGKPLRYSWKGHRSLRVSDYRIIYRVEKDKVLVIIAKVDIRRDIYEI